MPPATEKVMKMEVTEITVVAIFITLVVVIAAAISISMSVQMTNALPDVFKTKLFVVFFTIHRDT